MSLSRFNWIVVFNEDEVVNVVAEDVEDAVEIACQKSGSYQPIAVIRGELSC